MTNAAVQKEAFHLAGLLSNVMVQTLAKLSMLNLSKLDIDSGRMMTNDDAANLTKPDIGKCVTDSIRARLGRGSEGFIAVTTPGRKGFSVLTTRGADEFKDTLGGSFETSTREGFSDSIKKGSYVKAAPWSCASVDHSSGASALALRRWISSLAILTNCRIFSPALVPISSICASDASAPLRSDINLFSSLSLNWRRAISPCMAATIKAALLSPAIFATSIPSITSCGIRMDICFDLSLTVFVAMFSTLKETCDSVYMKSNHTKHLRCDSFQVNLNHTLSTGKKQVIPKTATPRQCFRTPGRLTKPLIEVTVMAGSQHTQTHPKFTWRFLALSANTRNVISITAATEREARDQSPTGCVMVFAGRLPAQEVSYVA